VLLAAAFAGSARTAEVIDRIAVTVDNEVITESELREEIRVTAFLNSEQPDFSPAARRRAAERLVEQALIRREMELARYPEPPPQQVDELAGEILHRRFQGSETRIREALREYGLEEADLRRHLAKQAATMRFIEYRFRPEVLVTETEVRECYDNRIVPAYRKQGASAPPFDDARSQCEDLIAAQRVDQLVEQWLKEARGRVHIAYREDAFQ
jgi:hypothetical protein